MRIIIRVIIILLYKLKGHSQLWESADLDTSFASLKSVYLNPKSNVRVGYTWKSALILPSVSFDPWSFTEDLFISKLLLILWHYFIIFGSKQYPNENTKITREWINNIAEQIIVMYSWKIDGERLHIFRKWSFLDLEPSTMIQTSCHFSPLCIKYWFFEFESIRRCLAFPGQIHW